MELAQIKKALVTGAGGFVGGQLALFLANKGIEVNAMHRPGSSLNSDLAKHPKIHSAPANLLDLESLVNASEGCNLIFHLAAYAQPWAKNPQTYYDVNVGGTINLLEAAKANKVERVVVTATAGTFGPQVDDSLITEEIKQVLPPFSEYERTKLIANEKIQEYVKDGMDIVIVSPTRVFGPGELSASNAVTKLLDQFIYKGFRFTPGDGNTTGNYAYVQDMINGHYLAALKGRTGENYILGGENLSYKEMLVVFGEVNNIQRGSIGVPLPIMLGASKVMQFLGDKFGITPAVTPPFIRKYTHNWATDISKAKTELGYTVTPFKTAVKETSDWIKSNKKA
ncbi:MAG: NAD-dependent epimerase/dehydratase family protein [Salibacteraceae bacterium]